MKRHIKIEDTRVSVWEIPSKSYMDCCNQTPPKSKLRQSELMLMQALCQ